MDQDLTSITNVCPCNHPFGKLMMSVDRQDSVAFVPAGINQSTLQARCGLFGKYPETQESGFGNKEERRLCCVPVLVYRGATCSPPSTFTTPPPPPQELGRASSPAVLTLSIASQALKPVQSRCFRGNFSTLLRPFQHIPSSNSDRSRKGLVY